MTKDEMKNKISMALKDPTLQQGFEIICKELEAEKQLNAEIKARFVKCNTCTDEMKSKCLMFSESLCQGERCEELVDLMGLISKSELEKENAELKLKLEALEGQTPWKDIKDKSELIKENAELKKELKEWKDEWQEQVQKATDEGYARTLQTMQLTKAKELIKKLYSHVFQGMDFMELNDYNIQKAEAEQFIKDSEVENDSKDKNDNC